MQWKSLITYFANYKEPTIVVFFGDHQPNLDDDFYTWINPNMSIDVNERMKKYMVPFFIWQTMTSNSRPMSTPASTIWRRRYSRPLVCK